MELHELPDNILKHILMLECLSQTEVSYFANFSQFSHIAKEVVRQKSEIELYFQPNCRDYSLTCAFHLMALSQLRPWSQQISFDTGSLISDQFLNYNIYLTVSDFTINKLHILKVLKLLRYKRIHLSVHFVLLYCDEVFNQIIDSINVALNDITVTIYLMYYSDLKIDTYSLKNLNIVLCSRFYSTLKPIKVFLKPNIEKLKVENHFTYSYPYVEYFLQPNNLKILELDGTNGLHEDIKNLSKFLNLEQFTLRNSTGFVFSLFVQFLLPIGLDKLKSIVLMNCQIFHLKDVDLSLIFPSLEIFHIISGNGEHLSDFVNVLFPESLRSLNISRKSLKQFDEVRISGALKILPHLDLSFNNLYDLKIGDLAKGIEFADLSYNRNLIANIPLYRNMDLSNYLFFNITNLLLMGCNINNQSLERLVGIYDSDTELGLSSLQYLSLSKNEILNLRSFNHQFFKNIPLRKINLSYNRFEYLNEDNFPVNKQNYPYIEQLDFRGNVQLDKIYGIVLDYDFLNVKFGNTGIKGDLTEIFTGKNNSIDFDA